MTSLNDFDRSIADFLADGPNLAPEAPVIAALAHARTTPRRPDLLARLRSDVMDPPRWRPFGLRPALVLAAGALVLGAVGVAVIGSQPRNPSIISPGPSAGPIVSPAASSSAAPSGSVSAFNATVPMLLAGGGPMTVTVTDTTGELIEATSKRPGDGGSVDETTVQIEADAADTTALVITWTGAPCETANTMLVDESAHIVSIARQDCEGDATPFDRIIRVRFVGTVAASDWAGTFVDSLPSSADPSASGAADAGFEPLGSPAAPPIVVAVVDEVPSRARVDVVDESGLLVAASSEAATDDPLDRELEASNDDATTVRLRWIGKPCDTIHRLTIDDAALAMTLDLPQCFGDAIGLSRMLVLKFSRPVDAAALTTRIVRGRGGVDMPTQTAAGPDSGTGSYHLTLADPGYVVRSIDGGFDAGADLDAGPNRIGVKQIDPGTLRLLWLAAPCATAPALSINATGTVWELTNPRCQGGGADVLRMLTVELKAPRPAETVAVEMVEPG
jgi:hypothetical protein